MDKHEARRLSRADRAKVRELFLREWDPIGISDIPEAADEYDTYANEAHAMLMVEHASADSLFAYQQRAATDHMGLSDSRAFNDASRHVADRLRRASADIRAGLTRGTAASLAARQPSVCIPSAER